MDYPEDMADEVDTPRIIFTEDAEEKLSEIIENHANPVAGLRLQINGRQEGRFQHLLSLVEDGAQVAEDVVVEDAAIRVFVPRQDVRYLDRIEINYYDNGDGDQGLEFRNPNALWSDPREFAIQELFDSSINPQIAAHGGVITLLAVEGKTAFVEFGGGCVGCGMLDVTLKQGVEVAVKEQVPDIDEIVDTTDHASGDNPYYQPAKK
ncbi:MAG: NifU family protein [Dehalococcoidia bacterium]